MIGFDNSFTDTVHRLVLGDARDSLGQLAAESVQLAVTSPPYWTIKDYENLGQIGFGQSYGDYQSSLALVWGECFRLLSPGCKLVINVGDQFRRAKDNAGRYEIVPIAADIVRHCLGLGFIFLGNIIWHKITTTKTSGGGAWMGSIYYPRDGYITYEHEYILLFKKPGQAPRPSPSQKAASRISKDCRSKWFRGVWNDMAGERQQNGHCAQFPLELPLRIIRMFSFVGETVLDPFVGSGTTMVAAQNCRRHSIGVELNPAFAEIAQKRLADNQARLQKNGGESMAQVNQSN